MLSSAESKALRLRRRLEDRVRHCMDDNELWPSAGEGLLVAVSGGQDSTALLLILARLAQRRPMRLHVAYFDHGLRGVAARQEERAAVEGLAAALELPFKAGSADVGVIAKRDKLSIEMAAREARYTFLGEAARESACSAVATGHTASDQAETVLMHLIRGSGVRGLAGMWPRTPWPFEGTKDLTLVRPVLGMSRAETRSYCEAAGIEPVEDETNASPAYRRNRVRNELMPLLRSFNPRVEEALVRLAVASREDFLLLEALETNAAEAGADRVWPVSGGDAKALDSVLRFATLSALASKRDVTARHIEAVSKLATSGRTGGGIDLSGGIRAVREQEAIVFHERASVVGKPSWKELDLAVPSRGTWGSYEVEAVLGEACDNTSVTLDAAAVGTGLTVRGRRNGDRMQPLGMSGTKKLQDIFVDAHVPRQERDGVPIFENERGIVWVGGLRLADWARPRPDEPVVTLTYRSIGPPQALK